MQKRIELSDRDAVESLRKTYGKKNNSHSFNALFVWRDTLGDQLYITNEVYSLNYIVKSKNTWLFPVGSAEGKRKFIEEKLCLPQFELCFLEEADVRFLSETFPDMFEYSQEEGDSEYLYDLKEHFSLESGDYYSLRKKISRAKRDHEVEFFPVTEENVLVVKQIIDAWKQRNPSTGELSGFGREIENNTVDMISELKYEGYLMYADKEPYGFKLGYALNDDVWDSAIENTLLSDHNLSAYMFVLSCEDLYQKGFKTINLEEDAGIEGLKIYKQSLKPNEMLKLYIAKKK